MSSSTDSVYQTHLKLISTFLMVQADLKNRFALPSHLTMGNFKAAGGDLASGTKQSGDKGAGLASYVAALIDRTLSWDDIAWLRRNTTLKIVAKGTQPMNC